MALNYDTTDLQLAHLTSLGKIASGFNLSTVASVVVGLISEFILLDVFVGDLASILI